MTSGPIATNSRAIRLSGALAYLASAATSVRAHHDGAPASDLPLWQMIAIALVVVLVFVAVGPLRKRLGRRAECSAAPRSGPGP